MTTQTVTLTILNQAASEEFGVVFAFQAFENDGTGVYNVLKDWGTDFDTQEGYLSLLATDPSIDIPIGGDEFAGRDVIIMMYMLIGFFPKDGEKVMYNEVFFFKPGMVTVTPIPETPEVSTDPVTAAPTASTVLVNGEKKAFDAYNIEGSNYFKLRDLAYVLNGTDKQFEVGWDAAANAISLTSGKAYTAAGGEMAAQESPAQAEAVRSSSKILLDGAEVALTAYTINGNNYFKLRDLGQAFDFGVGWDGEAQTISIDTSTGYTAE
ncbi:MAG: copper amine oxidase N-terminal domain-containing protein [Oscillospiraceae bacterium]|nr:copper amine oxidase N-terminal domain-containing protein [Oscillospiraceae bacterium]